MGAWGTGHFENDAALDWIAELDELGEALAREALRAIVDAAPDAYLDVDDCCAALAAAEIIASCRDGEVSPDAPDDVKAWIADHPATFTLDDGALAHRAIVRVAAESELQELWDEEAPNEEWHTRVDVLGTRLTRP